MEETSKTQSTERFESLGALLHRTRIERGIELEQIIEETKISGSNLRAMESDNFHILPADAFARGFYAHYARALQLNPDEIVARFLMERNAHPSGSRKNSRSVAAPPGSQAKRVSSMAEPTGVSPISTLGFVLLLLIIIAGGICWYLSINPAAYLSEMLRGVQHVEDTTKETAPPSQLNRPAN